MSLPLHLWEIKEDIRQIAQGLGLDFFKTYFEIIDYKRMNEIAAFGGFPTRYPHWRFGMEYEQLYKSYSYGLSKIYEMVINNDPCYAYLLEGNNLVDQKTVIAHVYGHCDFFKNNYYFSKTNRKMMDEMANHATRVRRYIDRYGLDKVESFIDVCLSIDNLIDFHSPYIVRERNPDPADLEDDFTIHKLRSKDYMDTYINPPEYIEAQKKKHQDKLEAERRFPENPSRDIMRFLLEHSPLERWEADLLSIIREEAYYFAPQGMTKIMNEGWACVKADTYVFTDAGMVTMEDLVARGQGQVFDGQRARAVTDKNIIRDHDTVTIRTRRGVELCGSNNHRVLLDDGVTWRRLDALALGDSIALSGGGGLWPTEQVDLDGLMDRPNARAERIPEAILRSTRPVVSAFLRGLFDEGGHAGKQGVLLFTATDKMAEQVQLLLMNFGALSHRSLQKDGRWHVHLTSLSASVFSEKIGFGLERKQDALNAYIDDRRFFKRERWADTVVDIERGRQDVYDITVAETHRYAASGLINHNSYWHSKIMTEHALDASEIIDYAESYAGVMATAPGSFNPYKIGIELFRNIEDRWNKGRFGKAWEDCPNMAEKESWDTKTNLGREKIFQVRAIYNDITFIDEFLTEDFAREQKLFTFAYNKKSNNWEINSRDFKEVKQKLLFQLTNFGQPYIYVKDGNFENRAELLLHHQHNGFELRFDYARDVLQNIYRIWRRPVNIETLVEDKGRLLTFDGKDHTEKPSPYHKM